MLVDEATFHTTNAYDANPHRYSQQWDDFEPAHHTVDLVALLNEQLSQGSRVLDLGSGSGRDLKRMVDLGLDPHGLDVSESLARIAGQHAPVTVADMRSMPFSSGSFDGVLAAASLLHLPFSDVLPALREIYRVLRSGGFFALGVKEGTGEVIDDAGRFFHLYEAEVLDVLLAEAGFIVQHQATDIDEERHTSWLLRVAYKV